MDYLRVVNLEKYQHYTQRNPPWVKLHADVFTSYDFGRLPDQTKWHALAITLLASKMDNEIPNDVKWIQSRTQSSTAPNIQSLIDIGFLEQVASTTLASCKQNGGTEESRGEKRASAKLRPTPPKDSPEWVGRVFGVLPTLPLLNHPSLYDWVWWAKVNMAYPLDNGKIDIVLELKKMEAYYASNPAKQAKKNWKVLTYKWIGRAIAGAPWMKEGYHEKERFMKALRTHD